jgi:hypothetical protein
MTPDELARLMAVLDAHTDGIVADAIQGGWFESREAHSVDALIDLVRPGTDAAGDLDTMVHVVVDYDALTRGHTVSGEQCEIPGTRVTKLEDLARICRFHHHLKTFLGYTYRGRPGTWRWIPPANRDVDSTALRRVITDARRC